MARALTKSAVARFQLTFANGMLGLNKSRFDYKKVNIVAAERFENISIFFSCEVFHVFCAILSKFNLYSFNLYLLLNMHN